MHVGTYLCASEHNLCRTVLPTICSVTIGSRRLAFSRPEKLRAEIISLKLKDKQWSDDGRSLARVGCHLFGEFLILLVCEAGARWPARHLLEFVHVIRETVRVKTVLLCQLYYYLPAGRTATRDVDSGWHRLCARSARGARKARQRREKR